MPRTCAGSLLTVLLASCVAGSEGPRGPGTPTDPDPEPQARADLFPGPIETPEHIRVDSVLEMRVGVRNGGTRNAGPGWVVRLFFSSDPIIDSADIQVDHFIAPRDLAAGGEDQYLRHKKLRASTPPGSYYVGSMLDVTRVVPEVTEGNNTLVNPATILLTPKPSAPPGEN
ncbi:MAG TPA: CARDB domain-containing protein [Gemmatimonadales bacterium]|nr:CARDB domain-containing protein [Gemmatimonadales bacterium]